MDQIAIELKHEFPEIKGFSRRNVYAILQWYKFYSIKYPFVPRDVAQIPWGHNRLIITKTKNIIQTTSTQMTQINVDDRRFFSYLRKSFKSVSSERL
ncbi:MAG: DUF1016 N-terminal domain-containing protein [Bacteroidales bacterium]|nr:DUF1016 N-terminal domain-containing protein [Bacteroidales bacterium]